MGDVGVACKNASYEVTVTYQNQYMSVSNSVFFSYQGTYYS